MSGPGTRRVTRSAGLKRTIGVASGDDNEVEKVESEYFIFTPNFLVPCTYLKGRVWCAVHRSDLHSILEESFV